MNLRIAVTNFFFIELYNVFMIKASIRKKEKKIEKKLFRGRKLYESRGPSISPFSSLEIFILLSIDFFLKKIGIFLKLQNELHLSCFF